MANKSSKNNSMESKLMVKIDFKSMADITLFTGRKNGKKAKTYFNVKDGDSFVFLANEDQVITSSYFLGLVGEELTRLLSKSKDINDLISKIEISSLNKTSQDECIRAIKRGLSDEVLSL